MKPERCCLKTYMWVSVHVSSDFRRIPDMFGLARTLALPNRQLGDGLITPCLSPIDGERHGFSETTSSSQS
jgi:hypothetical protein